MKKWVIRFLLLTLLLAGCRPDTAPDTVIHVTPVPSPAAVTAVPPRDTSLPATPVPTEMPTPEPTEEPTPSPTPEPTLEERIRAYISSMTVEEKVGQLCMFGFSGTKSVSSEFSQIMRDYHIGSVILYGQNIARGNSDGGFKQCLELTDSIRAASESAIPLLISTDVEGGTVTRFKWKKSLESGRTLGKKMDTERAKNEFLYIGEGLLSAGINVDLAPVLDVSKDPDSHFMGKRIISSDENTVSEIGAACVDGLHEAGVLSIVKHFPGHGSTNTDSHDTTPKVSKSYDSLRSYDFVPFRNVLRYGADGVMVSHILFESIDSDHIASQSSVVIGELLRGEYEFDGIVMSDDFRMAGLRNRTSLDKAAVRFLLAGGDLILCGANHEYQKKILTGIYNALQDGTLTEERIDESVYRILSAKLLVTDWSV